MTTNNDTMMLMMRDKEGYIEIEGYSNNGRDNDETEEGK